MEQRNLFPDPRQDATDEEVVAALRIAIARSGKLPRMADLFLNSVCAEHVLDQLRGAGLEVVRAKPGQPSE